MSESIERAAEVMRSLIVNGHEFTVAEFIAHARTDVPRLVAAIRAVLDLIDSADANPGPYARILHTTQVRNAITAHLEDR